MVRFALCSHRAALCSVSGLARFPSVQENGERERRGDGIPGNGEFPCGQDLASSQCQMSQNSHLVWRILGKERKQIGQMSEEKPRGRGSGEVERQGLALQNSRRGQSPPSLDRDRQCHELLRPDASCAPFFTGIRWSWAWVSLIRLDQNGAWGSLHGDN